MPDILEDDILMSDGKSVWLGFYGYKDDRNKATAGFVDYASWNDAFGYEYFEDDIKYWMKAPKPPCGG